jgi:hypothetical protein
MVPGGRQPRRGFGGSVPSSSDCWLLIARLLSTS